MRAVSKHDETLMASSKACSEEGREESVLLK